MDFISETKINFYVNYALPMNKFKLEDFPIGFYSNVNGDAVMSGSPHTLEIRNFSKDGKY